MYIYFTCPKTLCHGNDASIRMYIMRDTDRNDILSISARLDQVTQKMEELMDRLANHYSLIEGLLARVEAVETYNRSYYQ